MSYLGRAGFEVIQNITLVDCILIRRGDQESVGANEICRVGTGTRLQSSFFVEGEKNNSDAFEKIFFSFGSSCCFPRRQALVGSGNRMWAEGLGRGRMP